MNLAAHREFRKLKGMAGEDPAIPETAVLCTLLSSNELRVSMGYSPDEISEEFINKCRKLSPLVKADQAKDVMEKFMEVNKDFLSKKTERKEEKTVLPKENMSSPPSADIPSNTQEPSGSTMQSASSQPQEVSGPHHEKRKKG